MGTSVLLAYPFCQHNRLSGAEQFAFWCTGFQVDNINTGLQNLSIIVASIPIYNALTTTFNTIEQGCHAPASAIKHPQICAEFGGGHPICNGDLIDKGLGAITTDTSAMSLNRTLFASPRSRTPRILATEPVVLISRHSGINALQTYSGVLCWIKDAIDKCCGRIAPK